MYISKMQKKFEKMFLVSKIIAVELNAESSLCYDKNTCHLPSTCYQTVLRFQIRVGAMTHISISLILIRSYQKSAAVQTSGVFRAT